MGKKLFLPAVLGFIFLTSVILTFIAMKFLRPNVTEEIATEISNLGLEEVAAVIRETKCKKLERVDGTWIVKDCKDGVYIKIFFEKETYAVYCYDSNDKREIFKKVARLFYPPQNCLDESLLDFKASDEMWESLGFEVYMICGRKVVMKGNCIVAISA